MIIGIDGNEANVARKVGISEYAFELLRQFNQISNFKSQSSNRFQQTTFHIYLKDTPRSEMPEENEHWKYIVVGPKKLWTQIGLPLYLFTHFPRPHVFFSPTHYAPRFSPVPTAIAVMDLSFLHFPTLFAKKDLYQLVHWTKYSVDNAKTIFTISIASKNDILEKYHVAKNQVVVTYPGIKPFTMDTQKRIERKMLEEKFGIRNKYVLFVGTLQPRKNIERLIEAFSEVLQDSSRLGSNRNDLQLVVVGKKGWLYEGILAAPTKFGIENKVRFLEFVSNEDLPTLYKEAECFVLPSLYEGFGLPVLEAMQYGCPVITSNVSSLPEAGGDAALYVDPQNAKDIAEKIEKVLTDEKLRESMIKKGFAHVKKFSWEKTAKQTLEVLQQLAAK